MNGLTQPVEGTSVMKVYVLRTKTHTQAMKWRFYIGLLWGLLVCILYGIFFISFNGKLLFAHQSKSVFSISEDLISYFLSCNVGNCDHRSVGWLPDMLFLIRFPHSSPARLATWSSSNGYPIQHHHTCNTFLSFVSLVFRLLLKRKKKGQWEKEKKEGRGGRERSMDVEF